jgi:uncharacterized protein (UPF0297 family)
MITVDWEGRDEMQEINNTQYFRVQKQPEIVVKDVIDIVYLALTEKGYNPVNQIVGYIMSGDPTYITNHRNARSLIMKVERDEILEELMHYYIDNHLKRR